MGWPLMVNTIMYKHASLSRLFVTQARDISKVHFWWDRHKKRCIL